MPADYAHIRLLVVGILEAIGEPVGHGVAEHQDVVLGHHGGVALLRRRRLGVVLDGPRSLMLEGGEEVAAEPAAGAARGLLGRWPRRPSEIEEKLCRGGRGDGDQQHQDDRQHGHRTGFGEQPQKGSFFSHSARSQRIVRSAKIVTKSGCKRADFPHASPPHATASVPVLNSYHIGAGTLANVRTKGTPAST